MFYNDENCEWEMDDNEEEFYDDEEEFYDDDFYFDELDEIDPSDFEDEVD